MNDGGKLTRCTSQLFLISILFYGAPYVENPFLLREGVEKAKNVSILYRGRRRSIISCGSGCAGQERIFSLPRCQIPHNHVERLLNESL